MLIFLFCVSCNSSSTEDSWNIEVDDTFQDSLSLEDHSHKYGFSENDTPVWYMKDADDIVIEEIAESFLKSSIKIQGFSLESLLKGNAVQNLNLKTSKSISEINFRDYLNENKTIYVTKNNDQIKRIAVNDLKKIDIILDDVSLSELKLSDYKEKYPGSYSLRNLFSVESSSHLAPLDSIKSIQHTFLWTDNGRLDLVWVNEKPHMLEYLVF